MCRLVFHKALCLAFVVEKFTEHQLPQSGTPYLPSPICTNGQPQPVADIATNGCFGIFRMRDLVVGLTKVYEIANMGHLSFLSS
jgi:hypothetical protein